MSSKTSETRIQKLIELIKQDTLEAKALIIFSETSIRYLTGFTGEEAQLIVFTNGDVVLLSDSRFLSQIKTEVPGFVDVVMKKSNEMAEINQVLNTHATITALVEGDFLSATAFQALRAQNNEIQYKLVTELVEHLRLVKDADEIALIQKAIEISELSFNEILPKIVAGKTERELAAELEFAMKLHGASGPSFETIVASGVRSAWPHGKASDKQLAEHELITIDFGCVYEGYVSDITRTVALGSVSAELNEIYNVVLTANKAGIAASVSGKTGADVDFAARSIINNAGYGEYFGHGIGHGIGLDIHEINSPTMRFRDTLLEDNLIVTVEPGIYLPDKGGVRIEDDVRVGQTPAALTSLPKEELIIL